MGWFEQVDDKSKSREAARKQKDAKAARSSPRSVVEKAVVTESAPRESMPTDKGRFRSGGKLPPPSKPKPKVVEKAPEPAVRHHKKAPSKARAKKTKATAQQSAAAAGSPREAYMDCTTDERDIIDYELRAAYDVENVQQVLAQALQTLPGENGPENTSGDVQRALRDAMNNLGAGFPSMSEASPPQTTAPEEPMGVETASVLSTPQRAGTSQALSPPMSHGEMISPSDSADNLTLSDLRDSELFHQEVEKMKREHAFVTSQLVRSFREEKAALTGKLSTLKEIMLETQSRLEIAYLKVAEEMNAKAQLQQHLTKAEAEREGLTTSLVRYESTIKDLREHVQTLAGERSSRQKEKEMAREEAARVAQLEQSAAMKMMEAEHKAALMQRDVELRQLREMLLRQNPVSPTSPASPQVQQMQYVPQVQQVVAPPTPPLPVVHYAQAPVPSPVQQVRQPQFVPSTVYVDSRPPEPTVQYERSHLSPNLVEFTIPKERVSESRNNPGQSYNLSELEKQENRLRAAAADLRAVEQGSLRTLEALKQENSSQRNIMLAEKEALIAQYEAKSMAQKLRVVTAEKDALQMSVQLGTPVEDYIGPEEVWV